MDFGDIVWIIVCIGFPILSGIISAGKKRKAKPVPPGGNRDIAADLKDVLKSIGDEFMDADTKQAVDDDEEEDWDEKPLQPRTVTPRQTSRKEVPHPVMKEEPRKPAVPVSQPAAMSARPESRPAAEKASVATASATASVHRPAAVSLNMMTAAAQRPVTHAKPRAADAVQAGAIGSEDEGKQSDRERIDPKKLIEYNAIMNPAFKEY